MTTERLVRSVNEMRQMPMDTPAQVIRRLVEEIREHNCEYQHSTDDAVLDRALAVAALQAHEKTAP